MARQTFTAVESHPLANITEIEKKTMHFSLFLDVLFGFLQWALRELISEILALPKVSEIVIPATFVFGWCLFSSHGPRGAKLRTGRK